MIQTFETLAKADKKTLDDVMENGKMPDLESMAGFEFDGYNLTFMASILGIRKFRKGFYKYKWNKVLDLWRYAGYNVKMKQNSFKKPWEYKGKEPKKFGWFEIFTLNRFKEEGLDMYPNATILHYGLDKRNTLFEGKMLRDYLVQVNDNDKDLYLGKAYNAIGKNLVMPSYFIIKRAEKVNF